MSARAAAVLALPATAPRHLVLAAAVTGLLLGPRAPAAVVVGVALVAAAALASARAAPALPWALAGALLLTAWGGAVRVRALEHTALGPDVGHVVRGDVTILQSPRTQAFGGWSALARYRGEPVLLRVAAAHNGPAGFAAGVAAAGNGPPGSAAGVAAARNGPAGFAATPPPRPGVGEIVGVRAAVRAPDAYAEILRAHAVLRALDVRRTGARRGGLAGALDAVRRRAERGLAHGRDPTRVALLQGMVLGQDAGLPQATREEVRAAGLSHLTAASGANVVLLMTLVLAVAALTGVPFRARWLVVLLVIVLYVPLAGGGPSIQRAGVMGAAGVVAVLAGRPSARWYALGLAALLTLAADPRAAADPGWQLSFAAVAALLVLARPWAERLTRRGLPRPVAEALAVTASATLATAPVIAVRFGELAPLSLPANLAVAPVVAPVMWLGAGAASLGAGFPPLAGLLDALADPLLRWVLAVAHAAAGGPGASLRLPAGVVLGLCLCVLAAVGAQAPPRVRGPAGGRIAAAIPAALAAALLVVVARLLRPPDPPATPPVAGLRVSLLDVGQGDATLLEVPGHAVLVDAGPPAGPILRALERAGVRRLDALVVTHAQADHAGGATAVVSRLPVGLLLDGSDGLPAAPGGAFVAAARARGVRVLAGRAGLALTAGSLTLRILSPGEGATTAATGADPNRRAIVAEASAAGGRVLLTADAESEVLAGLDLGPVDVLKVAHHGSADPGLPALLERLQPLVAGIEVGVHNPYGHPAPATLRALRTVPRTVRTDRDGTVRLDLAGGRWTVSSERSAGAAGAG